MSDELQAEAQFREMLASLRAEFSAISQRVESAAPSVEEVSSLAKIGIELDRVSSAYGDQLKVFAEQKRRIEEAEQKLMAQKKPVARDDDKIQKLSEELTTGLRLQRVDAAIKELLDFLADTEFFPPNASIGRKRKLRTLQTAIEQALEKPSKDKAAK